MTIGQYFRDTSTLEPEYRWRRLDHDDALCAFDRLAAIIADQIVRLHCRRNPTHYAAWKAAVAGGPKPAGAIALGLQAFLGPALGLPNARQVPSDHLEGFIAEHLWYFVMQCQANAEGIIRIEPPSFKSTDPGADGLAVVRNADDSLTFYLWEIKKRLGDDGVSGTIGRAALQLKTSGTEYLARHSCTAADTGDPELESLYSKMVEHWAAASQAAAAGISVLANSENAPATCFGNVAQHLPGLASPPPPRILGQLTTIVDIERFATTVQGVVWSGL